VTRRHGQPRLTAPEQSKPFVRIPKMSVPHLRRSFIAIKVGVTNLRSASSLVILSVRGPRGQVFVRGVWKRRISCRLPIAHHKGSHPERSVAEPKDLWLFFRPHLVSQGYTRILWKQFQRVNPKWNTPTRNRA